MTQCADNFRFDITAWRGHYRDSRDMLLDCMNLAFSEQTATHWSATSKRLILFWTKPADRFNAQALICPTSATGMTPMVREWLAKAEYGPEPDHDGSNSKGWRVFNEAWGHVEDESYAICGVEPAWLCHGK